MYRHLSLLALNLSLLALNLQSLLARNRTPRFVAIWLSNQTLLSS